MTRFCLRKKSDPRMGFETSARRNGCWTLSPENLSLIRAVPNVLMEDPFAARSPLASGEDLSAAGKTEMSAPVSTRNAFLDSSSCTDRVPGGADVMTRM